MGGRFRLAGCLCAALALAACGGHAHSARTGTPTTPIATKTTIVPLGAESRTPMLVYFKRVVGLDPLASELTVRRDHSAVALITYGGPTGQRRHGFVLTSAQYARLAALIGAARRSGLHDTGCCRDITRYTYTVMTAGRAVRWEQRGVPSGDRRLITQLNQLLDGHIGD